MKIEDRPLKIYNASAGSGKTYHLVKEYVKLLVDDTQSRSFSNIIAMTFTNKAALEMKERIIKALDEISSPELFNNRSLELALSIGKDLNLSKEEIEKRCKTVLSFILHQYEEFHVMTIDKFNLRLIRSFSRDLDISTDFEVVMDENEVFEKIVDELLSQLGNEQHAQLNKLLLKYAETNVDEGKSWNIRSKLIQFGSMLSKEKNATKVKQLMEMDFSLERYGTVIAQRNKLNASFGELTSSLKELVESSALEMDLLPGRSYTYNPIIKLAHLDRFEAKIDFKSATLNKNLDIELKKGQVFPEEIKSKIRSIYAFYDSHVTEFAVIQLYLDNFFNMALLQFMARALELVRKEEQIILISEFNSLISLLIQNENAPFIYERLGTKFKHFLLDEFQDTSHLQWLNLVPLVHESLGYAHQNLIVGDPKQSIYRFKNGVAEQFVELPEVYNPENLPEIAEKSHLFKQMGETFTLNDNWRSSPTIVNFNNTFFERMRQKLPTSSFPFYNSVNQNPKSSVDGKICIESRKLEKEKPTILPKIIEWIEACRMDGFKLGDIYILGSSNRDCNQWALGLTEAGYKVVSADSLLIGSNLKVQLTIAYLNWRFKPSNENAKKQFAEIFFRIKNESYANYSDYIVEKTWSNGQKIRVLNEIEFIETYFKNYASFFFKYENLYNLVQGFFRLAEMDELENPYLHHLADYVYDFELKKGPNLAVFLEEFQLKKNNIAVQVPPSNDAIQIMTIHKSKGLEFPVVILPNLKFSDRINDTFLVQIEDFVVYKKPTKTEILQPLIEIHDEEKNQQFTDNVNLLYVAMTRPVERLYILNEFSGTEFGSNFHEILNVLTEGNSTEVNYINESGPKIQGVEEKAKNPTFQPKSLTETLWFPDIALQDKSELTETNFLSREMQFGIQFHLLISRIEGKEDIEPCINSAIQEGEVDHHFKDELSERLDQLLDSSEYISLFENKEKVINEQSIIVDSNTILRPDKIIVKTNETIIIDYKTGIPNQKDIKQVNLYKHVLDEMGFPQISCYLFYSSINELRLVS